MLQFWKKGAVTLGVSRDSVASHKKFEQAHGLPFNLLSNSELKARLTPTVQDKQLILSYLSSR